MEKSREVLEIVRKIFDGFPTPISIDSECDESTEMKVSVSMNHNHKVYSAGFKIHIDEITNNPDILTIKSKALRKMAEKSLAKSIAGDFTFDIEDDLETAVMEAIDELRR